RLPAGPGHPARLRRLTGASWTIRMDRHPPDRPEGAPSVMAGHDYVHGYSGREEDRLLDQAGALTELLHGDTAYPPRARVLEAGCGVGAQTVPLATRSPGASILSIDLSGESVAAARRRVRAAGAGNVAFQQADIYALPCAPESFDHVFACFVLEHLP